MQLRFFTKGGFVWDQSGIRIIGIMRVSVCLGAILILEYLEFHLHILIPEYPKRTRPKCLSSPHSFPVPQMSERASRCRIESTWWARSNSYWFPLIISQLLRLKYSFWARTSLRGQIGVIYYFNTTHRRDVYCECKASSLQNHLLRLLCKLQYSGGGAK